MKWHIKLEHLELLTTYLAKLLLLKESQGHNQKVMGLVRLHCPSQLMPKDSTRCGVFLFWK
jgi:hypothetical protein